MLPNMDNPCASRRFLRRYSQERYECVATTFGAARNPLCIKGLPTSYTLGITRCARFLSNSPCSIIHGQTISTPEFHWECEVNDTESCSGWVYSPYLFLCFGWLWCVGKCKRRQVQISCTIKKCLSYYINYSCSIAYNSLLPFCPSFSYRYNLYHFCLLF